MELTATVRRLAQYATRRQRCAQPNTDWTLSRDLNDSTVSLSSMLWATRSLPAPREITSEICASYSVVSSSIAGNPLPSRCRSADRLFRISSILVHFFSPLTFFAAVRAGVRFLFDPVTARKFFSLDWSDPVLEAVSCVMSVVVSFRCSCINAREA